MRWKWKHKKVMENLYKQIAFFNVIIVNASGHNPVEIPVKKNNRKKYNQKNWNRNECREFEGKFGPPPPPTASRSGHPIGRPECDAGDMVRIRADSIGRRFTQWHAIRTVRRPLFFYFLLFFLNFLWFFLAGSRGQIVRFFFFPPRSGNKHQGLSKRTVRIGD